MDKKYIIYRYSFRELLFYNPFAKMFHVKQKDKAVLLALIVSRETLSLLRNIFDFFVYCIAFEPFADYNKDTNCKRRAKWAKL